MKYAVASFLALLISLSSFSQKGKDYFLIDSIKYDSLAINDKALIDSLLPKYHKGISHNSSNVKNNKQYEHYFCE